MKSFSVVVALACFAANASAGQGDGFEGQNACDVKYSLHENLAAVLGDPVGLQTLNVARESIQDICEDPKAHNALVDLLDVITDLATDPSVSQTLGNALFWARQVLKERNFRVIWLEQMRGLNTVFENVEATGRASDAMFDFLERLFRSPYFDTEFKRTVSTLGKALKARNDSKMVSFAYNMMSKAKNLAAGGTKGRSVFGRSANGGLRY